MIELVFEIGCEDLPARFVEPALEQLDEEFCSECEDRRIAADDIRTVGTPRRLTLLVGELAETQKDLEEVKTGPPVDAAYANGEPTGAAEGFAGAHGVDVSDLFTVEKDHGEYVAANVREEGEPVSEILPELLSEIVEGLDFPKSMRWADHSEKFGRPVRWMVAVAGSEVMSFEFAGVRSGARTQGHRFAAPEPFEVRGIDEYLEGLEEHEVVVDPDERRDQIREMLREMGVEVGGRVVEDPELVDEVVNLVEKPHATRLDYGDEYLELPDEVLVESMRSHQRYFAIETEDGDELLPHCGVIYNTPVRDPEVVNRGNLRVLRARLDDARFFWDNDLETPPEERLEALEEVVWLETIGTMRERAERISRTARRIAEQLDLSEQVADDAERAGMLSKSDLVTEMVGEFPKLQGVMGREYALEDGEREEVAEAIAEQYMPDGADGDLPETEAGACVALAEKLDALVGCFGVEMEPTSTSDPYGLRRAALGVIRILEEGAFTTPLSGLFEAALGSYDDQDIPLNLTDETLVDRLREFAHRRLRYLLADDHPTDVVDAVLAAIQDDVVGVRGRVEALAELRSEPDFEALALGFKRVVSILENRDETPAALADRGLDVDAFVEPEEETLHEAYRSAEDQVRRSVEERDWREACEALIGLKEPVDAFFESVMVMADDPELQDNRLALLARLWRLFRQVADISKIQT
jgi:glycyl-tRNA synthetase beta chain